jgi:hypothetical protein
MGSGHIVLRKAGLGFAPNVWAARPAATDRVLSWTLASNSRGQYEIRNVPPDTWEVAAFAPVTERCLPFQGLPHAIQTVTIADGETKLLDLDLAPGPINRSLSSAQAAVGAPAKQGKPRPSPEGEAVVP